MNQTTPRDLGVPVKSVNWVRVFAGQRANGEPVILMSAGQDEGGLFVADIDPTTGHCAQYPANVEYATFPTAFYFSARTGVLYIGSAYIGHFHRYNANLPVAERRLEDLGKIDPERCAFPCGIDEAPDGSIYIGAHPGCCLTRFDPRTDTFTRFGRMDETDMYLYPMCGSDGTIAAMVRVSQPHVVVFDPESGEHRTVGPVIDLQDAYAQAGEKPEVILRKGTDGLVYIVSTEGNYRLKGMEAIPVGEVPEPMPASSLPDGSMVDFADGHLKGYRELALTRPDGVNHSLTLDWEGGGTSLFLVHHGPNGLIYGSSILPEHLFVCDLDGGNMRDLGACSESIGEAYSMGNFDGKLYIASYPYSRLSIYDPAQPYRFGTEEGSNPRDIGRLDEVGERPRAMLTGPANKVWIGSFPDYGLWGGTLAWHEPATGASRSHRHLVPDCSVTALEWIPELELILVGTSIIGGTGTNPRATAAPFVLWNPHTDEAVETLDFGLQIGNGTLDLRYAGNGTAYAIIVGDDETGKLGTELVLLDVVNRAVLDRTSLSGPETADWPIENTILRGPDGAYYGCCRGAFYRIIPGTTKREILWSTTWEDTEAHIHAGGTIVGSTYYYGSKHHLRAIDIPAA